MVDGALVVSEVGTFGVNDGGIERVDLASETAQGFFVTEADLGGDITDFVLVSDHLGYALVAKADFTTTLVAFDPTTAHGDADADQLAATCPTSSSTTAASCSSRIGTSPSPASASSAPATGRR